MPIPQPPPLRPRSRLRLAGLALGACFLATLVLVAALYLEENWRGARAWAACERELAAKGESLVWRSFIPPPVPDDQNLAMAPFFVRECRYRIDPKTHVYTFGPPADSPDELKKAAFAGFIKPPTLAPAGWDLAKPTDLVGYQRAYRGKADFPHAPGPQSPAADVCLALTRYAPALDELAQAAAERPLSRFPVLWEADNPFMTALPQYNVKQVCLQVLRLRASAELASGQTEAALHDLELSWRFCRDMRKDPVVISYLVQITCLHMVLIPVWEGMTDRRWSSDQLARLQGDLQRFDLLEDYVSTFRGERAFDLRGLDFEETHRDPGQLLAELQSSPGIPKTSFLVRLAYRAVPRGWFDFNKATLARYMQDYLIEAVDPKAHRMFREKGEAGVRSREHMPFRYTNLLARLTLPIFDSMSRRAARLQTGLDEAATACALERFFLDHQAYPARLDELVPGYLDRVPTDVIDGTALRYRQTPDGRYQLYGIGWNGRDDGGTVAWDTPRHLQDTDGDWVWQYAALQPPPPAK